VNSGQKILVDCDGVLSDMTGAVLEAAARDASIYAKHEDVTCWDYGEALGWKDWRCDVDRAIRERELVYRMKPIKHALEFLHLLEDLHGPENVYVCTAPWDGRGTGQWLAQRSAWLRDFMQVSVKRQIHCDAKELVEGWLIDDKAENLRARTYKVGQPGFLIDRPWNQGQDVGSQRGTFSDCLRWVHNCHYNPATAGFYRNLSI
jgi:5'(3')-deoxyribonucleotidase